VINPLIAIDPGAVSGAWALLYDDVFSVGDLPVVDGNVDGAALSRVLGGVRMAVVERVGSMPGQGIASAFKFGTACGIIRGVLAARGVPVMYVTPGVWKKHFKLDADKEKCRRVAIERFPDVHGLDRKKDHGRAEALLMGIWYIETQEKRP
jgi:crossover junction endodeoxyribonuclease RuvC